MIPSKTQLQVLLDELGMNEGFLTLLRSKYFQPLSQLLFPEADRHEFDSHKAFTVDYEEGKDIDLALHFDNAEVIGRNEEHVNY